MSSGDRSNAMPVFRPLKTRPMFAGVGIPEFFTILATIAIGVALFFVVGLWMHEVEVPIGQSEALTKLSELQDMQKSVEKAEHLFATTGSNVVGEIDLSEADAKAYSKALSLGIDARTTRDELIKLVPDTVTRKQPVIPDIARGIVFIAMPFFVALAFLIEFSPGQNLKKDIQRTIHNSRRQHVYITEPKNYLKENL